MDININQKVNQLLKEYNVDLAYITKFGSILYGTSGPNSDQDIKGLYWPHIDDLILQKRLNSISFTTGKNFSRNTKDDIDISLWSVQYWLELLFKGDTNAIDLLFSMYTLNDNVRLTSINKCQELLGRFWDEPIKLLDIKHTTSYINYAYQQARKYGLKGGRMNILREIKLFFESKLNEDTKYNKVGMYFDELLKLFEGEYCFEKESNNERCLWILSKGLPASVRLYEACNRFKLEYSKYGSRVEEARQNKNIDTKACSHAVRACLQFIELCETGFLQYPLKDANIIKHIKYDKCDWLTEIEPLISSLLDQCKEKAQLVEDNPNILDYHKELIMNYYNKLFKDDSLEILL